MKEPNRKRIVLLIARKLALKLFLVTALLSASVAVHAGGHFYGFDDNGDTYWLWCSASGNHWTKCNTGSCPTGQSCPCQELSGGNYQQEADERCARHGAGDGPVLEEPPVN